MVGIVIYEKSTFRKRFGKHARILSRLGIKYNPRISVEKALQTLKNNQSKSLKTTQEIRRNNLLSNAQERNRLWTTNPDDQSKIGQEDDECASSMSTQSNVIIPRADSCLISEFEVEQIRQIQSFLLFPILNPLSKTSLPVPTIVQVS